MEFSLFADMFKDCYGFRPQRGYYDMHVANGTLDKNIEEMQEEISAQCEDARTNEAKALVNWEKEVSMFMETLKCSWKEAVTHILDASDSRDLDELLYWEGVGYSDSHAISTKFYKD